MNQKRRKAKHELDYILIHQKTVTTTRLKEILDVLGYERIEKELNAMKINAQKKKESAKKWGWKKNADSK